jgi:hypothetical protein
VPAVVVEYRPVAVWVEDVVVEAFVLALGSSVGLGVGLGVDMGMMGLVAARGEAMMWLGVLVLFFLAGMGCLAAHHR